MSDVMYFAKCGAEVIMNFLYIQDLMLISCAVTVQLMIKLDTYEKTASNTISISRVIYIFSIIYLFCHSKLP